MQASTVPLLDSFTALADPTRCRLLVLLEQHDLMVSELCVVLQLPQSTVSRHLKMLSDAGLVASRREGTSRFYSLKLRSDGATELRSAEGTELRSGEAAELPGSKASTLQRSDAPTLRGSEAPTLRRSGAPTLRRSDAPSPQAELWQLARREFVGRPAAAQDAKRLERVLAARGATSRQFFATAAGQWDRVRDELFGEQFYWRPLLGLLPSTWVVGDLGCGTGTIAAALSPHVARVIGVDASDEMLKAAAERVGAAGAASTIDLRHGPLEALPITDASLDAALLVLVLHHLAAPAAALSEAFRVLTPGGRLLIVDMAPHEREEYRQQMGHVWLGFSDEQIGRLLEHAGFGDVKYHAIPAVTEAKGPGLFAAVAAKRH